jgi:hypothetical protein
MMSTRSARTNGSPPVIRSSLTPRRSTPRPTILDLAGRHDGRLR